MMADFSGKKYWLYKEIEDEFRQSVDPKILSSFLKPCLTAEEIVKKQFITVLFNVDLKRNFIRYFYSYGLILAQTVAAAIATVFSVLVGHDIKDSLCTEIECLAGSLVG